MITIPTQDKKWIQTNSSDILGNIFSSYGIDLSWNQGTMRSSDATILNTNNVDQIALRVPFAFKAFACNAINSGSITIFAATGTTYPTTGRVYYTSGVGGTPNTAFIPDATSGTPTVCEADTSDMEVFGGNLYVTAGANIYELTASGTWNNYALSGEASGNTNPKMMTTYANRLYITAGITKIYSAPISGGVLSTIATPGSQFSIDIGNGDSNTNRILWLRASSNRIWIGTINAVGGKGYVYEWDGSSAQVTKSYRLDCSGALACVIKDDIPYIMTTNGEIQVWNGGTFKSLDDARIGMPGQFNRLRGNLLFNPLNYVNDRFIHPNGMSIIEGNICVLVNTKNNTSSGETDVTNPAGIWEYTPDTGLYHKYGLEYARAGATFPLTDGGQIKIARAGALSEMNIPSVSSSRNGTLLAGAAYYTDATNVQYGIWYDDLNKTIYTPGHFVSTRIYSPNVTDMWQKIFLVFRRFFDANEKIIAKYRTVDADPLEATITWSSTSTFNTTANLSGYAVGDEVEIIQGIGAGFPSHITAIQSTDSGYMVSVDETYTGASNQTAIAWFQKWIKIGFTTDNMIDFKEFPIGKASVWIKFKIWFNFLRYDEIESLMISNAPNQKVQ